MPLSTGQLMDKGSVSPTISRLHKSSYPKYSSTITYVVPPINLACLLLPNVFPYSLLVHLPVLPVPKLRQTAKHVRFP